LAEERVGMIEARTKNRRGPALVLGCSENNDGIGRVKLLFAGVAEDEETDGDKCRHSK
jgi:hypothetical protein